MKPLPLGEWFTQECRFAFFASFLPPVFHFLSIYCMSLNLGLPEGCLVSLFVPGSLSVSLSVSPSVSLSVSLCDVCCMSCMFVCVFVCM